MLDIMDKAKKIGRDRNKVRSTVIKIEEYKIDKADPKNSVIVGLDMFNKDDNGIPKKVEVKHVNEKTNGIAEFANPGAMMHTAVGGMVRLSQYRVGGDGKYLSNHMQRIAKDDGPKVSASQDKFDISFMKGWTKIYPKKEQSGELAIFERNKKLFHRADAMVVPDDAKSHTMNFGDDSFDKELDAALASAIDLAPAGTQPMLVVRMAGKLQADEIRIRNFRMDGDNGAVPLTKEEMIHEAKNSAGKLNNNYVAAHKAAKDAGETGQAEFVTGFALNAIGLKWDGKSTQRDPESGEDIPKYNDRSLIEEFMSETAQRHEIPNDDGSTKRRYAVDDGAPQYAFGILSYRTKRGDEGEFVQSDLDTFGRDRGASMLVSPNAGLDEKPNPYHTAAQAAASAQGKPAAAAAQPSKPEEQPAQKTEAAPAAQETQTAQPTQTTQAVQPDPQKIEEEPADFGIEDFDEENWNVDMEDIESQLSAQSL
ncbi:hypothetical protein [Marinobacter salarius]|uniref:Uncharacterized protein n=1 Tax=Marinobacter salarius TaxID=1420917 RepID=A0A1W6KFM8_9GAMM|nr:hypothetical protein [Marinobacter salarius]ARM86228.1 hypothetical protein MARSALSMR5_04208 [Marinobacter salarius]